MESRLTQTEVRSKEVFCPCLNSCFAGEVTSRSHFTLNIQQSLCPPGFYIGQWYRGMRQGYGVRVVNPKITPRDMLNIISTLAHAQHGLGVQDKKSVWNIANFPLQNSSDEAGVPQVLFR